MNLAYNVTGRKCFASMFYEFKSIYSIIDDEISTQKRINGTSYANVDILKMAYNIFFWGIGYNSERSYLDEFTKDEQKLFNSFGDGVRKRLDQKKKSVISAIKLDDRLPEKAEDWSIHYRYVPYDGHANILGHYYRHLFQTAKYITDNVDLEPNQKREYLKNLRAQLSNFEQLMLFYNATIWFPQEWKELFTTYRFIKNVPVELVDMGPSPFKIYKEEMIALWENENKKMFEGQGDISELLSKEKTAEVKSN
jgi:hypothetical protein